MPLNTTGSAARVLAESASSSPPSHEASAPATTRRDFLIDLAKVAGLIIATPLVASRAHAEVAPVAVKVYKDPNCGCCKEWIKHMQKAGFTVTSEDTPKMDALKVKLGVPGALSSCHTAVIGDYLVEGHVPADVVQKMLKEKPNARGVAVPGMPMGSPGMEGPRTDKYNVMLFDRLGKSSVYASR